MIHLNDITNIIKYFNKILKNNINFNPKYKFYYKYTIND